MSSSLSIPSLQQYASSLHPTLTRILTAISLIVVFLLALYFAPTMIWVMLVSLVIFLAGLEWARLAGLARTAGFVYASLLCLSALAIAHTAPDETLPYWVASAFWCLAPWLMARRIAIRPMAIQLLIGMLLLIPALLSLLALRAASPNLLLAVVGLVVIADSAAYFAGRRFGKHKLAPRISPGKTLEGAIGAWLAVTLYGLLLLQLNLFDCGIACLPWALLIIWMLFLLSVIGDLFESVLKRQAGVKDSGSLLPGHGGVLDRIDSLIAVLPVAALLWMFWK